MSSNPADGAAVEYTTEPALAQSLIEQRNGYPGHVDENQATGDSGLPRVGLYDDVTWEQFREELEERGLAALYRGDEESVEGDQRVGLRETDRVDTERPRPIAPEAHPSSSSTRPWLSISPLRMRVLLIRRPSSAMTNGGVWTSSGWRSLARRRSFSS